MKNLIVLLLLVMIAVAMSGCFPGSDSMSTHRPAGFFWGVWHGWIAPVSLIVGFFSHDVRIYEANNVGWWYDLGYYMAVIAGFGGMALSRKKKKNDS